MERVQTELYRVCATHPIRSYGACAKVVLQQQMARLRMTNYKFRCIISSRLLSYTFMRSLNFMFTFPPPPPPPPHHRRRFSLALALVLHETYLFLGRSKLPSPSTSSSDGNSSTSEKLTPPKPLPFDASCQLTYKFINHQYRVSDQYHCNLLCACTQPDTVRDIPSSLQFPRLTNPIALVVEH
jgi:hypothetical protein